MQRPQRVCLVSRKYLPFFSFLNFVLFLCLVDAVPASCSWTLVSLCCVVSAFRLLLLRPVRCSPLYKYKSFAHNHNKKGGNTNWCQKRGDITNRLVN